MPIWRRILADELENVGFLGAFSRTLDDNLELAPVRHQPCSIDRTLCQTDLVKKRVCGLRGHN